MLRLGKLVLLRFTCSSFPRKKICYPLTNMATRNYPFFTRNQAPIIRIDFNRRKYPYCVMIKLFFKKRFKLYLKQDQRIPEETFMFFKN